MTATEVSKRSKSRRANTKRARYEPIAVAATPGEDGRAPAEEAQSKRRQTGEKRARLNVQLTQELRALRAELTQALEGFDLRVGGRIADLLQSIEGDESLDQSPHPLTVQDATSALEVIVDTRPARGKGHIRQLRSIQRTVKRLRRLIQH